MLNCLKELTSVNGISANEGEIAEILVNKLNTLCDYTTIDKHGNVLGVIKAKNTSKTLQKSIDNHIHLCYNTTCSRPVGQAVKTPPSHGGDKGSIPLRVTRKKTDFDKEICLFFS